MSALAISILAHLATGDEMGAILRLPQLVKMKGASYTDFLLKGYAEALWLPENAIDDLNKAASMRKDSSVALLLQSEAHTWNAMNMGKSDAARAEMEEAVKDARQARSMIEVNDAWHQSVYVFASLAKANLNPNATERSQELLAIRPEADQLSIAHEFSAFTRAHYFRAIGRPEVFLADFGKTAEERNRSPYTYVFRMIKHFALRQDELAMHAYDEIPEPLHTQLFCYSVLVRASRKDANRRAIAEELIAKVSRERQINKNLYSAADMEILLLLGEGEQAKNVARDFEQEMSGMALFAGAEAQAKFVLGNIDRETLLANCQNRMFDLTNANFLVAVDYLAKGDREAAKRHLDAALDTGYFILYVHWWSEAILDRMTYDPDWLPWLPRLPEK